MKKILIQILKFLFSGLLICWLLRRIGIDTVWQSLHQIQLSWFFAALLLFTFSHFLGSYQWWKMLRAEKIVISYQKTMVLYFIGLFFNNLLIGGVGGDFSRMMDVRRISKNGTAAVSTVFMDRIMGLLILSGMALLASPYLFIQGKIGSPFQWIFIILILGWGLVLSFFFSRRFAGQFAWMIKKMMPKNLHLKAKDIYGKIYDFGHHRSLFMEIVFISLGVQSARIFMHYLLAHSLGCAVSPIYFFLFVPIIAILASLPISLGGIGMREQSGVLLFAIAGMVATDAFAMEFLAFMISVLSSLPGAVCFVFRKRLEPVSAD